MSTRYKHHRLSAFVLIFIFYSGRISRFKLTPTLLSLSAASLFYLIFVSILQVECIMSILIYKNLMKGYFAHKSKVVVLSKQDPFPKLNGKPVNS